MSSALSFVQVLSVLNKVLNQACRWLGVLVVTQLLFTLIESNLSSVFISCAVFVSILWILANAAYSLVRMNSSTLLTPMPIVLGWSALVFGMGALYQWLAPPNAQRYNPKLFSLNPADYPKVALLVSVGLLITFFCARLVFAQFHQRYARKLQSIDESNIRNYAINYSSSVFIESTKSLRIGYGLLALALLYRIGNFLLDGSFSAFGLFSLASKLGLAGVFALAFAAASRSNVHLSVAVLFASFESVIGISSGMRAEALLPFVSLLAGYYIGGKSFKFLAVGIVGLALALTFVTPMVLQVRQLTWGSGNFSRGQFSLISEAASVASKSELDTALIRIWRRLDYSPWQEAMMDQYNGGNAAATYRYIPWAFVPRILFPDKPRLEIGTEIGYAIQGVNQSSSFAGTVYGEMYWNGGWFSLVISSAVYGLMLGFISVFSLLLFTQNTWLSLMIGLYGILYGFTVDTHFSVNAVGQAMIFFSLAFLYRYLAPLLGFRWIR